MIRPTGQSLAGAAAAQVHAKHAHAAGGQLVRDPLHVPAGMAAGQAMDQQRRTIARLPRIGPIIMQNKLIAVGQRDAVLPGPIRIATGGQVDAGQRLRMATRQERGGPKRREGG